LASYGASLSDSYRETGVYTGRILRARSPPTCRSSRPRKVDLIITAQSLGITVPLSRLGRADEILE
jgi:putative ABC transport system substrate-binding protein